MQRVLADPGKADAAIRFYLDVLEADRYVLDAGLDSQVSYRSLFCQTFGGPVDTLCAGYVMSQVHAAHAAGTADWVCIRVAAEPASDRDHATNDAVLAALPAPFSARTWYGTSDSDGVIIVDGNVAAPAFEAENEIHLPLEVGYCDPRTIYTHLALRGGFARWPYGSNFLYLFRLQREHHEAWRSHALGI